MRISEPGFYPDISAADYFADPCPTPSLTQSLVKILLDYSPAHARLEHPRLAPPKLAEEGEKYLAAQAIGNAAHAIMIGRGKDVVVAPFRDWRTKDAQLMRAGAEALGKCVILEAHYARAQEMVKAAAYQLEALGLRDAFRIGQGETMLAWEEQEFWFRSLIDWLSAGKNVVFDYKTTGRCVGPHAVDAIMANDGWDIQAATQERGLDTLDPDNAGRRRFRFVAQENMPPYALTVTELPESVLTMGRKKVQMASEIWRRCLATDTWPMYPTHIHVAAYPGWMESRWLERETAHHERRERDASDILAAG